LGAARCAPIREVLTGPAARAVQKELQSTGRFFNLMSWPVAQACPESE